MMPGSVFASGQGGQSQGGQPQGGQPPYQQTPSLPQQPVLQSARQQPLPSLVYMGGRPVTQEVLARRAAASAQGLPDSPIIAYPQQVQAGARIGTNVPSAFAAQFPQQQQPSGSIAPGNVSPFQETTQSRQTPLVKQVHFSPARQIGQTAQFAKSSSPLTPVAPGEFASFSKKPSAGNLSELLRSAPAASSGPVDTAMPQFQSIVERELGNRSPVQDERSLRVTLTPSPSRGSFIQETLTRLRSFVTDPEQAIEQYFAKEFSPTIATADQNFPQQSMESSRRLSGSPYQDQGRGRSPEPEGFGRSISRGRGGRLITPTPLYQPEGRSPQIPQDLAPVYQEALDILKKIVALHGNIPHYLFKDTRIVVNYFVNAVNFRVPEVEQQGSHVLTVQPFIREYIEIPGQAGQVLIDFNGGHLAGTYNKLEKSGLVRIIKSVENNEHCVYYELENLLTHQKFAKTEFPADWDPYKIREVITQIRDNKDTIWNKDEDGVNEVTTAIVDNVSIRVVVRRKSDGTLSIITAYPVMKNACDLFDQQSKAECERIARNDAQRRLEEETLTLESLPTTYTRKKSGTSPVSQRSSPIQDVVAMQVLAKERAAQRSPENIVQPAPAAVSSEQPEETSAASIQQRRPITLRRGVGRG